MDAVLGLSLTSRKLPSGVWPLHSRWIGYSSIERCTLSVKHLFLHKPRKAEWEVRSFPQKVCAVGALERLPTEHRVMERTVRRV